MKFSQLFKRYLSNFPETSSYGVSFWQSIIDWFSNIPRIIVWFVMPAIISGIIVRIIYPLLETFPFIFITSIGLGFIIYFAILFLIGRWLEK